MDEFLNVQLGETQEFQIGEVFAVWRNPQPVVARKLEIGEIFQFTLKCPKSLTLFDPFL